MFGRTALGSAAAVLETRPLCTGHENRLYQYFTRLSWDVISGGSCRDSNKSRLMDSSDMDSRLFLLFLLINNTILLVHKTLFLSRSPIQSLPSKAVIPTGNWNH